MPGEATLLVQLAHDGSDADAEEEGTKVLGGLGGALPEAWYLTAKEVRRDGPDRWVAKSPTVTSAAPERVAWASAMAGPEELTPSESRMM